MPRFPWWLSLGVGFLSLSQEILWVRLIGFAYGNVPHAFSFVLVSYLIGIALGAAYGKRCCERSTDLYATAAIVLGIAGLFDLFIPTLSSLVIRAQENWTLPITALLVIVTAGLKSVLFPIAHHLGSVQGAQLGRSVSKVYFGNIIGSTLGPLVTGFWLMDRLSVDQCFFLVAALTSILAGLCLIHVQGKVSRLALPLLAPVAVALIVQPWHTNAIAKLAENDGGRSVVHMRQNRHGVIHVLKDDVLGDVVLGGNVYDGRATVDTQHNANRIDRVYLLSMLHPRPERVLVIGLSTGAWTRAILDFPGVTKIDVVEINPGYVDLIGKYPALAPILSDPRVDVHIDDARRWLRRHPQAKYDLIVANATFHWRAYSTNLLSREFFTDISSHLRTGGIFTTNTTGSYDVFKTAEEVFPHAYRYAAFVYASDSPYQVDPARVRDSLSSLRKPGGGAMLTAQESPLKGSVAQRLLNAQLEPVAQTLGGAGGMASTITDANMLPEYRHGTIFGPVKLHRLIAPRPARTFSEVTHK